MSADRSLFSKLVGPLVCFGLLLVARFRDREVLADPLGHGLSLLLIGAGVYWALRQRQRMRALAEFYLWITFILTLSILHSLSEGIAAWLQAEAITVLQVLAGVHLLLVIGALWVLGAWSKAPSGHNRAFLVRFAFGLLIVGAVIFWIGARTFPGLGLEVVSANMAGHLWTSANFMLATAITLAAFVCLTVHLTAAGDRLFSVLGLSAYLFGAVFWMLHLVYRLTVVRQAADEFGRTGSAPVWFEPWVNWGGMLFGMYSVLAYLAIMAYGKAFLKTRLTARWAGWFCIIVGLLAAPTVGPPFFIHALLWLIALVSLRDAR